jgi:hypothetical protein
MSELPTGAPVEERIYRESEPKWAWTWRDGVSILGVFALAWVVMFVLLPDASALVQILACMGVGCAVAIASWVWRRLRQPHSP